MEKPPHVQRMEEELIELDNRVQKLSDLYQSPNLKPNSDNDSVWIQYSPPMHFVNIYSNVSKRKRRRLRGKVKVFLAGEHKRS